MRTIGILTEDFRLFYDLVETLKSMNVPFLSLSFRHKVPPHVGVVITSRRELADVFFEPKVAADSGAKAVVRKALVLLTGGEGKGLLNIGVDPGEMPGLAVVRGGEVLETARAHSPEHAAEQVLEMCSHYCGTDIVVRVGHGDRENRNRILRALCPHVGRCEIVDETNTTPMPGTTDMESAIEIAMSPGRQVHAPPEVKPTPGKVRDVQRKSRIHSGGTVTLSKSEAEEVVRGQVTMEEAVRRKRRSV